MRTIARQSARRNIFGLHLECCTVHKDDKHEGNTDEESNRGYVVFKKRKKTRISWEIGGEWRGGGGVTSPANTPFYKQASGQIFTDDVNVFPPPRIFASWWYKFSGELKKGRMSCQMGFCFCIKKFAIPPFFVLLCIVLTNILTEDKGYESSTTFKQFCR